MAIQRRDHRADDDGIEGDPVWTVGGGGKGLGGRLIEDTVSPTRRHAR